MASGPYLPSRDEDLLAFLVNFSALITLSPTAFGLLAGDAVSLAALVSAFQTALGISSTPSTRTSVSVASKDTARAVVTADARSLAKRIQATPTVTAAQKISLGLTVADGVVSSVARPATMPVCTLVENVDRTHTIRLVDETTPTRRARPAGSAGAEVYSFVADPGQTPPADLEAWRFEGLATKSQFSVSYNGGDVGKVAYI
ncbi:MAG TPA: hypothetical protein VIL86_07600, partial [Tepidisphaeraceae bacterium]